MSVGEQLKQARTALQLSLKQVSQATKIQSWVLEALENDQLHTSMSPVYVKGFISTYAKLLRLEPEGLIAYVYPPPAPVPDGLGTQDAGHRTQVNGLRTQWTHDPGRRTQGKTRKSPGSWVLSPYWATIRRGAVGALGIAAVWAVVLVNPMKHVKFQLPHREASLTVVKEPVKGPEAEPTPVVETTQALELMIQARRDTWVSVKADGRLLSQQHLKAGSKENWKARRRLELVIAKPAQVEVSLNGQSISPFVMAHQGRLAITHQQIKPLSEPASTGRAPSGARHFLASEDRAGSVTQAPASR